ncbi:type II secretion system protein E [Methylomusa anaerophila]|uniref:Type II secretion system protein E n=1 Tax=Methylomusa anaerophila TaxID=1930071 RepID=A0A348AQH7_9FIRM|nr:type II secretion system protein E [Methylomusa anaerophila]
MLEHQPGFSQIDLSSFNIVKETITLVPISIAERYRVMPIKKEGRTLTLAIADPTNFFALDAVRLVSGCEIIPVIATEKDIRKAINQFYGVKDLVEKAVNKLKSEDIAGLAETPVVDDTPIVNIVNSVISRAIKERASDIHIEPMDKQLRVRYRIDGVLREVAYFPRQIHAALVSRIKIMSELDIAEKRLPQDGRVVILEAEREIDLRVSTLPTITGEKIVIRILDPETVILNVTGLGFSSVNLTKYRELYSKPYGMILVTGPTGSGKTTTLYSTLLEINTPAKNVITVEDPVEYRLDGVNQVQVNPKAGLTFASGLRSILRQDPNIVMVGEIRDTETADIAIRAALTGHLVLSTLHTNDAPSAITRLVDMGIEPFLIASSVLGVIAQRLVRMICPNCKQPYTPNLSLPENKLLGSRIDDITYLYSGEGCLLCGQTGYRGRMSIHEIMPVTPAIRAAINKRSSSDIVRDIAVKEGMLTMYEDGINKVCEGWTTVAEIMRQAYSEA